MIGDNVRMKRLCFNNTNTSQVYFLSQSKRTSIINSKGLMEFVSHAARISDQCGCAAPQQASTRRSRLALLGAVRRCGCATLLHNKITYLFRHLFPSPIQQVAIQVQNIHYDILQSNKSKANKELKMRKKMQQTSLSCENRK